MSYIFACSITNKNDYSEGVIVAMSCSDAPIIESCLGQVGASLSSQITGDRSRMCRVVSPHEDNPICKLELRWDST